MISTSIVVTTNKVELCVVMVESLLNLIKEFVEVALLVRESSYHITIKHHKVLILNALQGIKLTEYDMKTSYPLYFYIKGSYNLLISKIYNQKIPQNTQKATSPKKQRKPA